MLIFLLYYIWVCEEMRVRMRLIRLSIGKECIATTDDQRKAPFTKLHNAYFCRSIKRYVRTKAITFHRKGRQPSGLELLLPISIIYKHFNVHA